MRMCTRCNTEMLDGFDIKIDGGGYGLSLVVKNKLFGSRLGNPSIAVCSECGEISIFLEDVEKIKAIENSRVKKSDAPAADSPAPPEELPEPSAEPPAE